MTSGIAYQEVVPPPRVLASLDVQPYLPSVSSRAKRVLDLVFALAAVIVAAPVFAAIALAIKLSSPGPVLFRQPRLGLLGRPFEMLKFRTMRDGCSEDPHREYVSLMVTESDGAVRHGDAFKLSNDDRVTPVGRWLRRTSLDELPQFLNVLQGEMSVVGPRPPLGYEVELYEDWQLRRLSVRPGITGLWQVSGRNRLTYAEMCRIDVEYIDRWSLPGDLMIVLKTPLVMIANLGRAA